MLRWPSLDDYSEALYEPESAFKVGSKLRSAVFMEQDFGHIYSSGAFAGIARATIQGESWAVRLLLRNQDAVEKRYAAISKLPKNQRRYLLDTEYLPKEIFIQNLNNHYPVILIKWVDGENLSDYLFKACNNSDTEAIRNTVEMVREMRSYMRQHEIAHGDLSPENIMVTGKGKEQKLVLVDYDSMHLPTIADLPCDVGRGKLQHPKRPEKPLPIGKWADEMAYLIYDAGLNALSKYPELGIEPGLYEQKFLVSVDELLLRTSPIIEKLDLDDLHLFAKAANYAEGKYEAFAANLVPSLTTEVVKPQQPRVISQNSPRMRLYELARLLNVKPQELLKIGKSCGLLDKSNLSLLSEHEVHILKTAHKAEIQLIRSARSLTSIAEELSLPIEIDVLTTTKGKISIPSQRTRNQTADITPLFDEYAEIQRNEHNDSYASRFRNEFTFTLLPGRTGNSEFGRKIINSSEFTIVLNAPRSEHVLETNDYVRITQHGLNTLENLCGWMVSYRSSVLSERKKEQLVAATRQHALHAVTTESLGISHGDALIIINLDLFVETLNAPREEHVHVSGNEIKLSQHAINTLIEINNLVGESSRESDTNTRETKSSSKTSETTPTPTPPGSNTVAAIAAKHGLSNQHIYDIMRAEDIYEFQKNKHYLVEKIAAEDSRVFIHSEYSAATQTNIPGTTIRDRLRELSKEDRWKDSIVHRKYGWRCTDEVLTMLRAEYLKTQRSTTGQNTHGTETPTHIPSEKIWVTPTPPGSNTVAAIAAKHGLSNQHIFDIMRAENISQFQKKKYDIVEKIAAEDSRVFIHSEYSAATQTNIPRTTIRDRLRKLSKEDRWKDSIVHRKYGWRCTDEVLTMLKAEYLKTQRSTTVQNTHGTETPSHISSKKFVATLDQCAIRFSKSIQDIRLILNSQDFLNRLGEPLQGHTSGRKLRGSTQITDKALASLEFVCRTKNDWTAPKVSKFHHQLHSTPNAAEIPSSKPNIELEQLSRFKNLDDRFPLTLGDCAFSLKSGIAWVLNTLKDPKFLLLLGEPLESHLSSRSRTSNTGISLKAAQCLEEIFSALDQTSKLNHRITRRPGRKPHLVAPKIATNVTSQTLPTSLLNRLLPFAMFSGPLLTIATFVLAAQLMQGSSGWPSWYFYLSFGAYDFNNDVLYIWGGGLYLLAYFLSISFLFRRFYVKNWRISQTLPRRFIGVLLLFSRIAAAICIAVINFVVLLRDTSLSDTFRVFYEFQDRNQYLRDHLAEYSLVGIAILTMFDLAIFGYLYRGRIQFS